MSALKKVQPEEDAAFAKWAAMHTDLFAVEEVEGCYCCTMGTAPYLALPCLQCSVSCITKDQKEDHFRHYMPVSCWAMAIPCCGHEGNFCQSLCGLNPPEKEEPQEFAVTVDRGDLPDVGLWFDQQDSITIIQIEAGGLVDAWNKMNAKQVEVYDRIVEVNGIRDKQSEMLEGLKTSSVVNMKVEKKPANKARRCYDTYRLNGTWSKDPKGGSFRSVDDVQGMTFHRVHCAVCYQYLDPFCGCMVCPKHAYGVRKEKRNALLKREFSARCAKSDASSQLSRTCTSSAEHVAELAEEAPAQQNMLRNA